MNEEMSMDEQMKLNATSRKLDKKVKVYEMQAAERLKERKKMSRKLKADLKKRTEVFKKQYGL